MTGSFYGLQISFSNRESNRTCTTGRPPTYNVSLRCEQQVVKGQM
ncbi:hypothetical protein [Paenibacillus arenosi]|nr:hypothetical protein [Paenibacillus arenosi]